MKCKYCNAEVATNARFCTTCGKDLSKLDKCVHCGDYIENGESVCPHCGTEQPHTDIIEQTSSKKWLWTVTAVILLAIIGGSVYFVTKGGFSSKAMVEAVDSDSIAVVDNNMDSKSLKSELEKVLKVVVLDYDKSYFTDGFNDFYKRGCDKADKEMLEHPRIWWQYSDSDPEDFKIQSATKTSGNEGNAVVTIIGELYQVNFNVKLINIGGRWLIDEISEINGSQKYMSEDKDSVLSAENVISIEDAIEVAKNMIINNDGEFKGFSSEEKVNYILLNKYGYKLEKRYFIEREWDFSPLYYKNCIFAQSVKDGDSVGYVGAPTARGEGISSFIGFDVVSCNMVIAPFIKSAFEEYVNQIEQLGGKCIESDDNIKTYKLNSFDIITFKNGVMGIDYCIMISKE